MTLLILYHQVLMLIDQVCPQTPDRRGLIPAVCRYASLYRRVLILLVGWVWVLAATPSWAVLPDEVIANPTLEARAREISQELRCLVCQNQSIDDSNADLARSLRLLVRERLKAGDSDTAVVAYLTARYGDFIRLRPPFQPNTWLLWLTPPMILATGAAGIVWRLRNRRTAAARLHESLQTPPLTPDEQERLRWVLDDHGGA